jgi:hypothetical protein
VKRALVFALLALAGCGGDSGVSDSDVIRGWNSAVNDGDYGAAADRFAEGAVVEQGREVVLVNRAAAIAFNRSLPCRAEVTDIEDKGEFTLASFTLRTGRRGGCTEGGEAQVRFVIRDGLIQEWRQVPDAPLPSDSETALLDLVALAQPVVAA